MALVSADDPWILRGILICATCLGTMHPCGPNLERRGDMRVRAYTCTGCTTPPVDAEPVELEVWRRCCATDPNAEHLHPSLRHSYIHNRFAKVRWTGEFGRSELVHREVRRPVAASDARPVGGAQPLPPEDSTLPAVGRSPVHPDNIAKEVRHP